MPFGRLSCLSHHAYDSTLRGTRETRERKVLVTSTSSIIERQHLPRSAWVHHNVGGVDCSDVLARRGVKG